MVQTLLKYIIIDKIKFIFNYLEFNKNNYKLILTFINKINIMIVEEELKQENKDNKVKENRASYDN